jgi:hypothetical protein
MSIHIDMVNDFHLNDALREMLLDERRSAGVVDADLWGMASDDFASWLIHPN